MTLPLKRANIITGANGCGKSNLYQSMALIRAVVSGELSRTLSAEGGVSSVLWAGNRKEGPVRIRLGVSLDDFSYDIEIGLPQITRTAFGLDPQIKSEKVTLLESGRKLTILDRGKTGCTMRNADGQAETYRLTLYDGESAINQIADPRRFPVLEDFRRRVAKWRFYHGFRTDSQSPLRLPQPGVRTFIMASDGSDVAAALQTIIENGDDLALRRSISDAFPGSELRTGSPNGQFEIGLTVPGMKRPLTARELSDGQLRYLCLVAALMSPTPPPLIALNEPETSLHRDLLAPLARLCAEASSQSQLWLTTHSSSLANQVGDLISVKPIALEKIDGETRRLGHDPRVYFSSEQD